MQLQDDIPLEILDPNIETWRNLSVLTHRALHTPTPSAVNDTLRNQINADPDNGFAATYLFWIGSTLKREARFEQAISAYKELSQRYGDRQQWDSNWKALSLEEIAICQERLGDIKAAITTYQAILKTKTKGVSEAWCYYQAGRLLERLKQTEEAIRTYRIAANSSDSPSHPGISIPDLAQRDASRLESKQEWIRSQPEWIADALARALRKNDFAGLEQLASLTHFRFGIANSELSFVPLGKTLELLNQDLNESQIVCDPEDLQRSGGKIYLFTDGWKGQTFFGRVAFLICRMGEGWEWGGVIVTQPTEAQLSNLLESQHPMSNQPLPIPIKAPWPAGMSFRAGGVFNFAAEAVATGGPLSLLGWFARLILANNDCGWGPAGFYYNQFTHSGSHAFAIDFTRYRRGAPLVDAANGVPMLNVASGVVASAVDGFSDGDPINTNIVRVHHRVPSEPWTFEQLSLMTETRLRSEYWHLSGRRRMPSIRGMWAPQGFTLGFMDDTGNSAFPHLHFLIQDRDLGFASVRPTPMDGQTLNDGENYKCIRSTNVPL
ncbi:MAG TPA: tetratricopeptide repeat protein [Chitinophagaceae bacterium]